MTYSVIYMFVIFFFREMNSCHEWFVIFVENDILSYINIYIFVTFSSEKWFVIFVENDILCYIYVCDFFFREMNSCHKWFVIFVENYYLCGNMWGFFVHTSKSIFQKPFTL